MLSLSESSYIIRTLTQNEIKILNEELSNVNPNYWVQHSTNEVYLQNGPLRHGRTLYLREYLYDKAIYVDNPVQETMPFTMNLVRSIVGTRKFGKCFYHRLLAGQPVEMHDDIKPANRESIDYRYQIYLDLPSNLEVIINDKKEDPYELQNCVYNFNLRQPHAYYNPGPTPVTFMVFDLLQ